MQKVEKTAVRFLFFLLFLSPGLCLVAQTVSGRVIDAQTRTPLPGAAVGVQGQKIGAVTDTSGAFTLTLPRKGTYTLLVQYVGYARLEERVRLADGETSTITLALTPIPEELQTVVVTEGRYEKRLEEVTVSLDVIKPQLLENKNSLTIETGLNQVPGVVITENQANIRSGSGWSYGTGSRVLVMVDDIPLLAPDAGRVQWNLVPVEAVNQMEVVKGGASALFGTSAMNGVVNVRTAVPSSQPATRIALFTAAWNRPPGYIKPWTAKTPFSAGGQFVHTQRQGNLGLVLSGLFVGDQGYKYLENNQRARMHVKTEYSVPAVKGLILGLAGQFLFYQDGEALIWQSDSLGYIALDSSVTRNYSSHFYVDPSVSYTRGRFKHTFRNRIMGLNNTSSDLNTSFNNRSIYTYSEYQFQWYITPEWILTTGAVGAYGESNSIVFGGFHSTGNGAAYAQTEYRWNKLLVSAGLRYEYFALDNRSFQRPVFRAGLNYAVLEGTHLRASFGEGFRFPSMGEAFATTNVGAIVIYPNEDLQPEEGGSGEVGRRQLLAKGDSWRGFVDVSAFWMQYYNMMEFSFAQWGNLTDPSFGAGFKSINVGPTRITGFEASLIGQGKLGKVGLTTTTGYTYANPVSLDPEGVYARSNGGDISYASSSSDTTGSMLKYRYKHLVRSDVQLDYKGFTGGLSVRYNSFMQNIDGVFESALFEVFIPKNGIKSSREQLTSGDLLFDLRGGYRFSNGLELLVLVDNIFNRAYQPRPALWGAPRKFTLRMAYAF